MEKDCMWNTTSPQPNLKPGNSGLVQGSKTSWILEIKDDR